MDKRCGILIVSVTIFVLCSVGTASATNWSVDGSGGAEFTGIQDAINDASAGDTILVYSGVYYENVVVDKAVTLKGIDHPVVDARRCGKSVVTLSADGITVEGFNVTKASWEGAGIMISSSNNSITGNTVCHSNKCGIALYSSSNNTITDNNISNNNGGGIRLWHSNNNNTITGNNVRNNNDDGIFLAYSSNNNTGAASASGIPTTITLSPATMSATTARVASGSSIPATTTLLQATISATTTGAASISPLPATAP
jgi:parallel beta-helix repeat protein